MIFARIKNILLAQQGKKIAKDRSKTITELSDSWRDPKIPKEQWKIVHPQLFDFERGKKVDLFEVFCESVKTCLDVLPIITPTLLEIGCSSGYYGFVLQQRSPKISYIGIDFSQEFITFGKSQFPNLDLQVQDATLLHFPSNHFGIVVSGCVLLHLTDWKLGIKESCRVAQNCVVFHRTPVTRAPTTLFTKKAYGVKVFEWSFNEHELVSEVESHGFKHLKTLSIGLNFRTTDNPRKPKQFTYVFIKNVSS